LISKRGGKVAELTLSVVAVFDAQPALDFFDGVHAGMDKDEDKDKEEKEEGPQYRWGDLRGLPVRHDIGALGARSCSGG
jgi:hypothetical protein